MPEAEASGLMAELVEAHDALLDEDFAGRTSDSRVAASCELFTLEELRQDSLHTVYPVRVLFPTAMLTGNACDKPLETDARTMSVTSRQAQLVTVSATEDHSVSDLKQLIEAEAAETWEISGRRPNREGSLMGWELVQEEGELEGGGLGTVVLSYHLFLHDFGIEHGDILHAVVRK